MSWRGADAIGDFGVDARGFDGFNVSVGATESVVRNRVVLTRAGRQTVAGATRRDADTAVRSGVWRNMLLDLALGRITQQLY